MYRLKERYETGMFKLVMVVFFFVCICLRDDMRLVCSSLSWLFLCIGLRDDMRLVCSRLSGLFLCIGLRDDLRLV